MNDLVTQTTFGFFKTLKWLNGGKPDSAANNDDGTTSLTKGGTTIIVDQRTIILLEDLCVSQDRPHGGYSVLEAAFSQKAAFDQQAAPKVRQTVPRFSVWKFYQKIIE